MAVPRAPTTQVPRQVQGPKVKSTIVTTMPTRTTLTAFFLLIGASLSLGACNIIGPVAAVVTPPPTVPAEYTLQDRPTVVFIDDRENVVNPISFRRMIADKISEDLMVKKLVTHTIRPHDAMAIASRQDSRTAVMSIDEIGRAVGAEQVLYVQMVTFVDNFDGQTPRGMAVCRVRLIDVQNRKRLYPAEDADVPYRQVEIMTGELSEDLYRSRAARMQIYEMLAQELGASVAKLFYKHEPRPLGGRLGGR